MAPAMVVTYLGSRRVSRAPVAAGVVADGVEGVVVVAFSDTFVYVEVVVINGTGDGGDVPGLETRVSSPCCCC